MRVCTTDPISGRDVSDLGKAPLIIDGAGDSALMIFIEPESNRSEYLAIERSILAWIST